MAHRYNDILTLTTEQITKTVVTTTIMTATVSLDHGLVRDVANEAITSLLDARDFLALQLTHANGGMTDDELDALADEYLRQTAATDAELTARVATLAALIPPERLDADVVSVIFRCDAVRANKVLSAAAQMAALAASMPALSATNG